MIGSNYEENPGSVTQTSTVAGIAAALYLAVALVVSLLASAGTKPPLATQSPYSGSGQYSPNGSGFSGLTGGSQYASSSSRTSAASTTGSATSSVLDESAAFAALAAELSADEPTVRTELTDVWVAQIASAKLGTLVNGKADTYGDILAEYRELHSRYDRALLLWSGEWSSFTNPDFYVTVVATAYTNPDDANGWCDGQGIDAQHCFAKKLSHTLGSHATTKHR